MELYKITLEFEGAVHEAYRAFGDCISLPLTDCEFNESHDEVTGKTTLTMDGVGLTVTYEPVIDGG